MEKIESIEQLDALGAKICELLQVGIDKANTVVPETLQQIITWQIWNNTVLSILFFIFMIFTFVLGKHLAKKFIEEFDKDDVLIEAARGGIFAICVVVFLSSFLIFSQTIPSLIKVLTAPNLVIIEQLGRLVK